MMGTAPLVFVPGLGFRPRDAKMLREPVTYKADGWDVTIDSVIADRDGTHVAVTIYGPFKVTGDEFRRPELDYNGLIQARDRSGIVSSVGPRMFPMSHSFSGRGWSIACTANMDALTAGDHQIDILINEPLPITIIPVTLRPIADLSIPARPLEVSGEHHGVVVGAEAIARGADMTAVLLHAKLRPHPRQRFMRGLGTVRDGPRETPGVSIADEAGNEVVPFAATRELSPGPELRTIVVCPGLPTEAREVTITVPYVTVAEYTGSPLTLAIPSEGDITLGDDLAFVKVTRSDAPRGGKAVSVEFTGAWRGDRRLLFAESLTVGPKYGGVGFRGPPGEPPIATWAEDPTGDSATVTLESPNIQLRGPWRLPATLP